MNRKVLLLAGAISALFAGKSATTSAPQAVATGFEDVDIESIGAGVTIGVDRIVSREPAPAKSDRMPVGTHQIAIRAREIGAGDFPRFVERPMRRKVKYGKNRWVILG